MHRSHVLITEPPLRPAWTIVAGEGALVSVALHAGHDVSERVVEHLVLDEDARLREEDPFSDRFASITDNQVVVHRSRFEIDLNRPRDGAVYARPEDAWGLKVWRTPLDARHLGRSLALYDRFYASIRVLLEGIAAVHGRFVVLDLHTYNHRRGGPDAAPEPAEQNPDINLGTGRIDRDHWAPLIDAFMASLRQGQVGNRPLDVRENVRFFGGHFPGWIQQTFPGVGCALAVEVKKIFMDEWSGKPNIRTLLELRRTIASAARRVSRMLETT